MATPEGKVKKNIRSILEGYGPCMYYHMPVLNGMGAPSLDFICCYRGHYFAIEAKELGKGLSPRQKITKGQIEKAGGKVFRVDGPDGYDELKTWLDGLESGG